MSKSNTMSSWLSFTNRPWSTPPILCFEVPDRYEYKGGREGTCSVSYGARSRVCKMSFVSVYIYVAVYILEYLRYTEICQDSSTKLFTTLLVPLSASQACTTPLTPALKSVAELACHLRHIWEDGTLNCRSGLYTWSSNSEIYRRGEEEQKRKRKRRDEETRRRGGRTDAV